MDIRRKVADVVATLFGFGKITRSGAVDEFDCDGEVGEAVTRNCERWGDAALLSRPPVGAEVLYHQFGDERVIIGTRDRRYSITLEQGEAVIRAIGPGSPAYVRLRPNGDVQIVGGNIHLGAESVSTFVARADKVDAEIARIWNLLTGRGTLPAKWTVAPMDGGAALQAAALAIAPPVPTVVQSTAATKTRAQ